MSNLLNKLIFTFFASVQENCPRLTPPR